MTISIDEWLERYIYDRVKDESNIDCLRWADIANKEQMAKYTTKKGCCGEFEDRVVAPDGKTYAIGCNYGH
jgi:hypothetical protein